MGNDADAVKEVEPAPAKASLWEDFVDIFYAPSSVFARRSDGKFGLPLLLLIVIGVVLFFLTKNAMQPIMDAEFARQTAAVLRKNPSIDPERLAAGAPQTDADGTRRCRMEFACWPQRKGFRRRASRHKSLNRYMRSSRTTSGSAGAPA